MHMNKASLKIVVLSFFIIVLSMPTYGARFPDATEMNVVLTGKTAISLSELFGLSASGLSSVSLQLGRGDVWAVYLMKQDTKEKLWNDNKGVPARYNVVTYSKSQEPSLTISPYWLNLGTRFPEPKVGYYSFQSPFISERLNLNDTWMQFLQRLMRESDWSTNTKKQFHRCFTSLEKRELCIEVFSTEDYTDNIARKGYIIVIEVRI